MHTARVALAHQPQISTSPRHSTLLKGLSRALKVLMLCGLGLLGLPVAQSLRGEASEDPINLLFIGNSHSNNARRFLSEIAAAAGWDIRTQVAFIGGGTMQQHVESLETGEARYRDHSLVDLLSERPWDYVSIQQASSHSWDADSYRPYAERLLREIRQQVPEAEALLHVTWSRHESVLPRTLSPHVTLLDNQLAIEATNQTIGEELGLRRVHTGQAILHAYMDPHSGFSPFEPVSEAPPWRTLHRDGPHLNAAGSYLTGCLWFAFLTNQSPVGNPFRPENISPEQAGYLQQLAWQIHQSHQMSTSSSLPSATGLAQRILNRLQDEGRIWGKYTLDLSLDALFELYEGSHLETFGKYPLAVMRARNIALDQPVPYRSQPFGHVTYRWLKLEGNDAARMAFVRETQRYQDEVLRSPDGLVLHAGERVPEGAVLIDSMQDYASRLIRAGVWANDPAMIAEGVRQFRLHRNLLRNPDTGLWSQGRGYDNSGANALSPGAWSRGQGWVLRGLVDAMEVLPESSSAFQELHSYYRELLDALLPLQDERGSWHALLHLPEDASAPETSGTALICRALYRGLEAGWIESPQYHTSATRAFQAIARNVSMDGMVSGACIGPGPLDTELLKIYLGESLAEDEPHGRFAVLYACAARARYLHTSAEE